MLLLITGLILFLGMHSISIVNESWRNQVAARFGEWPWKGVYSIVAITGLVLIIMGYSQARLEPTVLYSPPGWTVHLSMLLMLFVFPALIAAYFPGRISDVLKHPMLVAVKFWALAHLISNGTLADVLLFGSFLAWAVVDRISMKRRTQRPIIRSPRTGFNDVIVVAGGLGVYLAFVFWLHAALFGVAIG